MYMWPRYAVLGPRAKREREEDSHTQEIDRDELVNMYTHLYPRSCMDCLIKPWISNHIMKPKLHDRLCIRFRVIGS